MRRPCSDLPERAGDSRNFLQDVGRGRSHNPMGKSRTLRGMCTTGGNGLLVEAGTLRKIALGVYSLVWALANPLTICAQ